MICGVHALVGAALGSLTRHRATAAGLGVAAHAVCDLIPHRDLSVPTEVALLAAALGGVGATCGVRSTEFAGALGGALPDLENVVPPSWQGGRKWFPSHRFEHARGPQPMWPTALIAAAALACLASTRAGRRG
jgi:hypothetical protein